MWRELFSLLIVTMSCLPASYSNLESYFMNNFQGRQRGKGGGGGIQVWQSSIFFCKV